MTKIQKEFYEKWLFKIVIFSSIGIVFYLLSPNGGMLLYWILVFSAVCWFLYEFSKKTIKQALALGLFLMIFDWIIENLGSVVNLWQTRNSLFFVWNVPIEIMILAVIGGTAWTMHFPKKLNEIYIFGDSIIFALFGTIGEILMINNGLMTYNSGWTSIHAFIGYFFTWLLISVIWYRAIKK